MNAIPFGAALCTECESWQFNRRGLALSAKFAFVLLVPVAAWAITAVYQREEHIKASTQAAIARTAEQTSEVLEMNKAFQLAFDTLLTNCSKEGQAAGNLCLAEYVTRLVRVSELVSEFSWKSGILPMPDEGLAIQREWQDMWWGNASQPGIGGAVKQALVRMTTSGALLKCEELDFAGSACGGELEGIFGPFRQETNKVMCAVSLELRKHTLAMYASLPNTDEIVGLIANMKSRLAGSYCANLLKPRPRTP